MKVKSKWNISSDFSHAVVMNYYIPITNMISVETQAVSENSLYRPIENLSFSDISHET